jgi:hypothetical protein
MKSNQASTYQSARGILVLACVLVGVIAALFDGCTPGTLSKMWRDSSFQGVPLKNVLVIAVRNDPVRRRIWEDGFVLELSKHGVIATPSYRLFPDALPDTQQCVDAIRRDHYDGVLETHRLGVDTTINYIPGYTKEVPITRFNSWTNTYYTYYRKVEVPRSSETERTVRHEVNVWAIQEQGHLVWSAIGGVLQQESGQSVNHEIAELIVPELANQGIIPPTK